MNPARAEDDVSRVGRGVVVSPGGTSGQEDWRGGNDAKTAFVRGDGSSFKNQGDCIQYVNTGK